MYIDDCRECKQFRECANKDDLQCATRKRKRRNAARKAREQAMRDCGLVKVRGALGGVYWE